jgi:hypothetical protein
VTPFAGALFGGKSARGAERSAELAWRLMGERLMTGTTGLPQYRQ